MRLNKMKLAAAMMSAVMAASTMSAVVFAEEVPVVGVLEEQVEAAANQTLAVDKSTVVYDVEAGTISFLTTEKESYTLKATITDKVAATCQNPGSCKMTATTSWGETISAVVKTAEKADHAYGEKYTVTVKEASCTATGEEKTVQKCKNCEATRDVETNIVVPVKAHNFTDVAETVKYVTTDSNVRLVEGGEPELIDKTKPGTYKKQVYKVCKTCDTEQFIKETTVTLDPTAATVDYVVVTGKINIDSMGQDTSDYTKIDPAKIVLSDCSKKGVYTVSKYDKQGGLINTYEVDVEPHHTPDAAIVEGKTAADKALIKINTKDGKIVSVTSTSCHQYATYVETVKCRSKKCSLTNKIISQEEKIAEPAGSHTKKLVALQAVTELQTFHNQDAYDAFLKYAARKDSCVKYESTVSCEAAGKVTIKYLCKDCGEETADDAVEVSIAKLDHKGGDPKQENVVEATCEAKGSYDAVTYCKYCDKVMSTKKVTIPAKNHTTEKATLQVVFRGNKVVDNAGNLLTKKGNKVTFAGAGNVDSATYGIDYGVYADVLVYCDVCGQEVKPYKEPKVSMTITDIKKEDGKGNAGSISLKVTSTKLVNGKSQTATLEKSFPYYSTMVAYLDRNTEKEPEKNGIVLEDGEFRYYVDGQFQKAYAGIQEFGGSEFFVANGVICTGANGLNMYDGKWYMLSGGRIARGYTNLAMYGGEWFYLVDGELDVENNGIVEYNGAKFALAAGRLLSDVNGLWQNPEDGVWYFLAEGRVVNYTGTTTYNGETFELADGKLVV